MSAAAVTGPGAGGVTRGRPVGAPAVAPTGAAPSKPPLDDVMLAMDVVDTLRRRERLVRQELTDAGKAEDLKERLRRIYAAQGIEVPDHVIEQGVAALREERFTYQPPPRSFAIRLARIYVGRGHWGKWLAAVAAAGVLAWTVNYLAVVRPTAALPERLADLHREVAALATTDQARARADQVLAAGQTALRNDNRDAVKAAMERLKELERVLEQEYTLRIVNRPGELTGVWRIPDVNTRAKNYYIVVEAVDPSGRVLQVPIQSEETKRTERVKQWGLRVDERTARAVQRDKQDDGIVQNDRFGYKPRGALEPAYEMPTTGGAITEW